MEDFNEFSFTNRQQFYRGETSENILQECIQFCGKYLNGAWLHVSQTQVEFKRITGGLTNQLYYCSLPNKMQSMAGQPNQVLVKLYGKKHFNDLDQGNERFNDAIISILVAEHNLGPKIYGIFPEGAIIEYIQVFFNFNTIIL